MVRQKKEVKLEFLNESDIDDKNVVEEPPVVQQVVEIVDTQNDASAKKNTARDSGDIEDTSISETEKITDTELEEVGGDEEEYSEKDERADEHTTSKPVSALKEKHGEQMRESVQDKTVVEELFTKEGATSGISQISAHRRPRRLSLISWVIIIIVASCTTGLGLLITRNGKVSLPIMVSPTPTPSPVPSATPSPTVVPSPVAREDITIEVLNGGGVPGAALKMKNLLVEKGYKISNIGNTEEYTYDKTEIHVKPAVSGALKQLTDDLTGSYTLGITDAKLSESSSADAEVIVGKE